MGGASIGAVRLQQALSRYSDWDSLILTREKNTANPAVLPYSTSGIEKRFAFGRFAAERLYLKAFEKAKEQHWAFDPALFGANLKHHPAITDADILHLHWINHGFLSTRSLAGLALLGKPLVWTMHDMWPFTGGCHHSGECENYTGSCGNCKFLRNPSSSDLSHSIWKRKEKALAPSRLTAVACSDWLAGRAQRSGLFGARKVVSIPNPLDTEVFTPVSKVAARRALGLPEDKHLILFAAMRLDAPMKGFSYFREALERLAQQIPESRENTGLLLFGQSDAKDFEGLPYRAHALGRLSDPQRIAQAYAAASVFVIPSLEENLPYTIMEAMACGTPAVGFEIGGIPELIDDGINGGLATYRSAESLSRKIAEVLYSPGYDRLSENARAKVLASYSEKVIAGRYAALYEETLKT